MRKPLVLLLTCAVALGSVCSVVPAAQVPWQDIFDGKTLDGWVQRNGKAKYTVEDEMIVGETVLNTPNSFLCTEKMYTDFVLELEFLVDEGMNSGIQIRSNSFEHYKNYRVHGYQVEIDTSSRAWSGGIYDEARRGWLYNLKGKPQAQKAFKQGNWNHYRIEAIGDHISTWVNGVPAADLTDDMTFKGFIALQVHGSKQEGNKIRWRNIRIKDLSRTSAQLKALIVDGQNNHDWKGTTPVLKNILQDTGLFTVDVATSPPSGQPMDTFRPNFAKYDVIVSNYTGDSWPKDTQDALVEYMENGGGLVIYHAADNAFPNWGQWNEMIAIGGWGGRDEKSGPMVRWRDGKIALDESPGPGGTHGPQHEFQVITRDRNHAITAGLPEKWMHATDELYSRLRGPAKNMTILATAYADRKKGGTGEHEPALFTVRYGKGRIFHTVLGHGPEQLRSVGFIFTLQRGTEWAATGRVTQIDVPSDFPSADQVSLRTVVSADYSAIEDYDFGKSRRALAQIEEQIRNVPPSSFPMIEAKLLNALRSPRTTFAGKQFVCRMLRRVGAAQSVPALSEMLADEQLSHMARFALQHMPAPEAAAALRDAMDSVTGDLRIGVIGSLGQRGDRKAVPAIAKLLGSSDTEIADAAMTALGRIGGAEAAEALAKATVPRSLRIARDNAYLMCADKMLADGQARQAAAIYRNMTAPDYTTWIRVAAYKGLVRAEEEKAVPHIIALLKDKDLDLQRAAGKFITEIPGTRITEAIADQLPSLSDDAQVVLLAALEARADKAAAPYVAKAVTSNRGPARLAAIRALAVLGGASEVELLAKASAAGGGTAKAARDSLSKLSGPGVTDALIAAVRSDADASVRANVIQTLIDRGETDGVQVLFIAAKDSDADVRRAACKALGALAGQDDLQAMVSMLRATDDAVARNAIERAIVTVVTRLEDPDAAPIIAGFAGADNMTKHHLLAILPHIGGQDALRAVRAQLRSDNLNIQKDAIRALANWPDATPLAELMEIAKTDDEEPRQILALRGYIKLLEIPANRGAAETVKLLTEAMAAARRPEEKKAVLAALPKYPCEEALDLAKRAGSDRAVVAEADLAARKIKEMLLNRTPKATASLNGGNAGRALDGDRGNRWDTGRPMKPGDWFVLDLGLESTIKGLTLDSANSPNDYPRGYEVYVSFDGGSWGKPVVTGKGTKPITQIEFAKPVRARFIRILQTGSSDSWFWSIHELKVELQ